MDKSTTAGPASAAETIAQPVEIRPDIDASRYQTHEISILKSLRGAQL